MTDYTELIRSLRNCSNNRCTPCDCGWFNKYQVDESCKEIIMWKAAAAIEALQAQLPKRGEWIVKGANRIDCSVCGHSIYFASVLRKGSLTGYNYCHNCGAKMDGEVEHG